MKKTIPFVIWLWIMKSEKARNICPCWWWNWYVALPKWHLLYWKHYYDDCLNRIEVHWWLTYASHAEDHPYFNIAWDYWILWFDTNHRNDTLEKRPKQKVIQETLSLEEQLNQLAVDLALE